MRLETAAWWEGEEARGDDEIAERLDRGLRWGETGQASRREGRWERGVGLWRAVVGGDMNG